MQIQKAKQGYKVVKSLFGNYEEIPEEWNFITFGEIAKIKRGASPRPIDDPKYFGKGRGWVRISDVSNSYKYLEKTTEYLSELGESKSVPVNEGDLIMSIAATVGKPILLKMRACIHDGFVTFSNLSPQIDTEFLFYLLSGIENRLKSLGQHGTQSNLNADLVSKITFSKPQLGEQKKIALILSNVDSLIKQIQKEIEQTHRIKIGLMQKLLIKGIGHTKFKQVKWLFGKEIEIPKEWELYKLKNLAQKIGDGIHFTPNYVDDSDFHFINGNNLINGSIIFSDNTKNVDENEYQKYKLELNENTVLLSINGTIGNVSFYNNEKIVLGKSVCYIICNPKLNKKFLFYLLKSNYLNKYLRRELTGTTISNLSLASVRNSPILLPKIEEQKKIASILSNIDLIFDKQQKYKSNLENLKKGLMQKLLTGQIRVKV